MYTNISTWPEPCVFPRCLTSHECTNSHATHHADNTGDQHGQRNMRPCKWNSKVWLLQDPHAYIPHHNKCPSWDGSANGQKSVAVPWWMDEWMDLVRLGLMGRKGQLLKYTMAFMLSRWDYWWEHLSEHLTWIVGHKASVEKKNRAALLCFVVCLGYYLWYNVS